MAAGVTAISPPAQVLPAESKLERLDTKERRRVEEHKKANATLATFKKPASWIVALGAFLALCAGIVDVVGWHIFGQLVTNQTGTVARLGEEVYNIHIHKTDTIDVRDASLILTSFIFGAFLCGILIDKNQVHFGGKSAYGLAMVGNSLLIVASWAAHPHCTGMYFLAAASGLQNAMCTSHFGAVVRTTHVTGTVTDIGSTSGRMVMILLRKRCKPSKLNVVEKAEIEVDLKKLFVLLPLLFGFWIGCVCGAYLEDWFHTYALFVPAAFTGTFGLIYMCFRNRLKEKLKRGEVKRLAKDLAAVDGALVRAHSYLTELRHRPQGEDGNALQSGENEAVVDLDEEVEHALEVVHEMEMTLEGLRNERGHTSPSEKRSPSAKSPRHVHV
jgi:uncharacterized membrane protein YoaK (UPF0700 family)